MELPYARSFEIVRVVNPFRIPMPRRAAYCLRGRWRVFLYAKTTLSRTRINLSPSISAIAAS